MAGSGAQPQARQPEVGVADSDIEQGGSRCPDIGTYLLGGGEIGPSIRVRDMDPDGAYEEGFGQIPPQGVPQDDGTTTKEGVIWRLVLPLLEDEMVEAGLKEVETYVYRRQNTVAQYIATRTIMEMCLAEKRRPGPRVSMRWW